MRSHPRVGRFRARHAVVVFRGLARMTSRGHSGSLVLWYCVNLRPRLRPFRTELPS